MGNRLVFLPHEPAEQRKEITRRYDNFVVIGLESLRHQAGIRQLVRFSLGERDGERSHRRVHETTHRRRDCGGVDPSR